MPTRRRVAVTPGGARRHQSDEIQPVSSSASAKDRSEPPSESVVASTKR